MIKSLLFKQVGFYICGTFCNAYKRVDVCKVLLLYENMFYAGSCGMGVYLFEIDSAVANFGI